MMMKLSSSIILSTICLFQRYISIFFIKSMFIYTVDAELTGISTYWVRIIIE